ncbi:diguanylate cyclase (GGDEF) domain-containing protein [Ruminococcus sp. YE71]|uniref:sensor domain-containing protein n=1 Tax=unclassified Ruminococcus TaxID=2608920 RepID=UPI0008864436|nr:MULTISPECIES: EAL domain-containing protein [unclassified Ruminococcus]SDA11103.1 diguanylate cyclase (GGDEF) domain-containing protein [Ruminococcus sp. YE78]SFW14727.1 diguanylate cyclase (GGDEF) domain-containing protein [Ruminococcus sp. YE71]
MEKTDRENIKSVVCGTYKTDFDLDGRIIEYDDGFLKMTGYERSQLDSGEVTFFSLIPPEIKEDYFSTLDALRQIDGGTLEHNIVTADGGRLGVICIGRNNISENGHKCADITISDISAYRTISKQYERTKAEMVAISDNFPGGLAVYSVSHGTIDLISTNTEYYRLTGLTAVSERSDHCALVTDQEAERFKQAFFCCAEDKQPFTLDLRFKPDGRWVRITGRYFATEPDGSVLLHCSLADITDKVVKEKLLVKQNLCFKMISENTEETFFDYDTENDRVVTTSKKLRLISRDGVFNGMLRDRLVEKYLHPDDVELYYSTWDKAVRTEGKGTLEFRTRAYDDEYRWHKMVYVSVCGDDGKVANVYGMVYSIDHLKTMKNKIANDRREIERLTNRDRVTELYNRTAFKSVVAEILRESFDPNECFALVYSDINDFSYVNENYGYEAGDRMLRSFAMIVCGCSASLAACRIYSDYFVSLFKAHDREQLIQEISMHNNEFSAAQKLRYPHSDFQISTGVYFFHSADDDVAVAIDNANLARRSIKGASDIPCGVYTERMRKKRSHDQTIASEIWTAIKTGAIELFLQPKFDLVTRKMIGAEALTRWRNPDGSYKLPYEFIEVLEEVGYITHVDMYIYEQVLKCLKRWKLEGKQLIPISVNFSRRHNSDPAFVTKVTELAEIYGVDKRLIELEITESCFTQDVKNLYTNMRRLREQGFRIDIDDFGTGYSSLSVLIDAPVDIVKVDKVFIDNIGTSELSRDYVSHICRLIQSTRKDIIFEGVETEEQARILASGGHTMAQGWLFDKAIPVEEFDKKYM